MPLFPANSSLPPRLPTDSEWATAYTAAEAADAAWQAAQAAPTADTMGWPQPRVKDFLPLNAGGEGLVWPPVAA